MAKVAVIYRQMVGYAPVIAGFAQLPPKDKEIVDDVDAYFTSCMNKIALRFQDRFNFKNVKWWFVVKEIKPPTGQVLLKKLGKKIFK